MSSRNSQLNFLNSVYMSILERSKVLKKKHLFLFKFSKYLCLTFYKSFMKLFCLGWPAESEDKVQLSNCAVYLGFIKA